jgi:hypothetical protein
MKASLGTETANDTQLVEWSLTGDREAFGRIVERYQSLVCSITYLRQRRARRASGTP